MKRIHLALIAFAVCGLCALSTIVTSSLALSQSSEAEKAVIELERKGWEAFKNKRFDEMNSMRTADFMAVYDDGIKGRDQDAADMGLTTTKSYSLSNIKAASPNKDTVVLTYSANFNGTYKGKNTSGVYHCSAVYVNQDGVWKAALYTEVKAKK